MKTKLPLTCIRCEGQVVGRVGGVGVSKLWRKSGVGWGALSLSLETNTLKNKQFIQPQPMIYDMRKHNNNNRVEMGFRNKNKSNNHFLQHFFFNSCSCFFFLLLFYFKTLKLESSVAPHTASASFLRLAELYTLWNPA